MERETGFEPATLSLGSSENKLILLDLDGHFSRFSDQFSKRAPHRLLRLVPRTISCAQIWLLSSVELPQPEVSTCSRKDQVLRKAIPDPAPGIRGRWWSTDLSHDLVMIGCQAIASGQTVPGSRLREHATGQTGLYCKPNETSACVFSGGTGDFQLQFLDEALRWCFGEVGSTYWLTLLGMTFALVAFGTSSVARE